MLSNSAFAAQRGRPMQRRGAPLGAILAQQFAGDGTGGFQDPGRTPVLPSRLEQIDPNIPHAAATPPPRTSMSATSPADARPDYVELLNRALGPRPEGPKGLKLVASILGPALMAASGNEVGASQMVSNIWGRKKEWDDQARQNALTALKWQRDDDIERAKRNEPQFLSGASDQVRYDPATGTAERVYDAPEDFQTYAAEQGLEPGTEAYASAVQDYVLRANGPTAFKFERDVEVLRNASRISQQAAQQEAARELERLRQAGRMDLRQTPQPPRQAAPRANTRGATPASSTLPLVRTPADALKLPSGTRFRTPDGAVKVRP